MNQKTKRKNTQLLVNVGSKTMSLLCLSFIFQNVHALDIPSPEEYLKIPGKMEIMQNRYTVKGTVKDQTGEPLGGVSIVVKGTITGTSTDWDGNFELEIPNDRVRFSFSLIGFTNQDVFVKGQRPLNVGVSDD